MRATKDDGSLFLERQRRLAFYALILFPNAAEPSSGLKALSLFRSKEEISLCPPSLARDAAHSLGKTNTKEQTEDGINLTAASLSTEQRRNPEKQNASHLSEPVQVRDRLLHRGRRPTNSIQAVRLEQGVARGRLEEQEEGGHDDILVEERRLTSKRRRQKTCFSLSVCFWLFFFFGGRKEKTMGLGGSPEKNGGSKRGQDRNKGLRETSFAIVNHGT